MVTMSYPFTISPSGSVEEVSGVRAALQQVKLALSTSLGSRAMRPSFGSQLPLMVFEVLDDQDNDAVREHVKSVVKSAVPGVVVNSVRVNTDLDAGAMEVSVLVSMEQDVDPRPYVVSLEFGRVVEDRTP